jgi:ubiquinone/menaquinone biosynthesis C-methylase UbiE
VGIDANRHIADVVREHYDRLAPAYDSRWPDYIGASVRETLRRLDLRASDRLLDIGCGTGVLLERVRRERPVALLAGIDISAGMIEMARRRLGPAARLTVADVQRMPFGTSSFDVVVSTSSFHYWPSPSAGLAEVRRILRPGGRLVITDWCSDYLACRLYDLLLRLVDRAHRRAYSSRECIQLLSGSGYRLEKLDRYRITRLWGLMTAAAIRPN